MARDVLFFTKHGPGMKTIGGPLPSVFMIEVLERSFPSVVSERYIYPPMRTFRKFRLTTYKWIGEAFDTPELMQKFGSTVDAPMPHGVVMLVAPVYVEDEPACRTLI